MAMMQSMASMVLDNDGRRSGADRRTYSYAAHFPERRVANERRTLADRRQCRRFGLRSSVAFRKPLALSY
jgi:hypothetical protein